MAEPQNIRDQFNDAIASGHPLMKRIYLDTLVTGKHGQPACLHFVTLVAPMSRSA